jgi:hypothetical protein
MAKKTRPKETKLQKKVLDYIKSNFPGSIGFKVDASIDGVPDLFISIPGFGGFWIEMKRDEAIQKSEQALEELALALSVGEIREG